MKKVIIKLLLIVLITTSWHEVKAAKESKKKTKAENKKDSKENSSEDQSEKKIEIPYWKVQLDKANKLFDKKKYSKSLAIYDEIMPLLISKKEVIEARYKQAYCNFYQKDYVVSRYQFEDLYDDYPNSEYAEEALYQAGISLYKRSPSIHFDPKLTKEALNIFEFYLHTFPKGKFKEDAANKTTELKEKIIAKELDIANTYYRLEKYEAAILTLQKILPLIDEKKIESKVKTQLLKYYYYDAINADKEDRREKLINAFGFATDLYIDEDIDSDSKKIVNKFYKKLEKQLKK